MNRKILTRLLSVLLVVVMTFGLLPVSASAAWWWPWSNDETQPTETTEQAVAVDTQAATGSSDFYRIVHLDCGRKYFSVDNIKTLIDTMAAYKYNQLQLAFGNGGLRFLLDDMGLTIGNTILASNAVKTYITNGNNTFNGDTRYLTQDDMDAIITYADGKGIAIVPMLNMPGHMNWADTFRTYVSSGALDVSKESARNFAFALLRKYAEYFQGKGCKFFHFGADESGKTGTNMTTFLTGCASIITKAGMTPRAFNDATNDATMPNGTQITYWHKEEGSKTASALSGSYDMINTHGRWYYVIKPAQNSEIGTKYWQGTVSKTATSVELPTLKAEEMDKKWVGINEFFDANPGSGSMISSNKGVMFCIWCDASSDDYLTNDQVISENENYGALYQIEKLAEHYWGNEIGTNPVDPSDKTVTVNLEVGGTKTFDVGTAEVKNYTANEYIATAMVTEGKAQAAGIKAVTEIESGKSYLIYSNRQKAVLTTTSSHWSAGGSYGLLLNGSATADSANKWTITQNGTGYTVAANGDTSKYLNIGDNTASVSSTASNLRFYYNTTGGYWNIYSGTCYLNDLGQTVTAGGWNNAAQAPTDAGSKWTLYEIVEASSGNNTLTITGTGEDSTTVMVGDTTYNITVTAPSKTETQVLNYGGSFTLPEGATEAKITSGSGVTIENGKVVAGQTDGTATVTCVTKNAGGKVTARYTYNITVSAVNLDIVPLSVQLWITNTWVGLDGTPSALQTVSVPAKEAYGEDGVLLSKYATSPAYKTDNSDPIVVYWHGTVHHDGTAPVKQGADISSSGDAFTKVRYWNKVWQYNYDGGWKTINETTDTVVAYYLQINNVSPEITTSTKHYGNPPTSHPGSTSGNGYNMTAFAVVYPDGTYSRTELEMYKTGIIRGYWGSTTCGLGSVAAENNSSYKVSKITLTWGNNIKGTSGDNWYVGNKSDSAYGTDWGVEWNKTTNDAGQDVYDETTYWDADTNGGNPAVDFDKLGVNFDYNQNHNAALILIYLEAVKAEDTLTVIYQDDSNNAVIKELYVKVSEGTDFVNGIQNNTAPVQIGEFKLDDEAYINNSDDQPQKFNKNLPTVPGVADKYKSGVFKYVKAELSDDGKTLTLHYVIDENRVKGIYVLDFGLPVDIPMSDFIDKTSLDTLTNVTWTKEPKVGKLTYDKDKKVLTYTPTSTLSDILTLDFTLTFRTGEPGKLTIGVMPASNVLYEENFLTTKENSGWSSSSVEHTTAQESQKTGVTKNVFGYDDAYKTSADENGAWKASNLASNARTGALTADFYGNGFDLIGNCGQTTGRVMLIIAKQGTKQGLKAAIVDTRYKTNIYQVPLAHLEMGAEGAYTAYVYAAGLKATGSKQAAAYSAPALMSVNAANDPAADILAEYGLSVADAEYIGSDQIAASPIAVRRAPAVATYASIEHGAGDHVEIAGFRVYRDTTGTVAQNYPTAEQNLTYTNIIDFMAGQLVTANVEDGTVTDCAIEDYEDKGGPQNEVYLSSGQFVIFATEAKAGDKLQVSLRAVNGPTAYNQKTISSATEMYYEIDAMQTQDGSYVFAIANTGDNLLGIGNVKLPTAAGEITTVDALSDETILSCARAVFTAAPEPVEPELFTPDTFKVHVTSLPMFRSKIVTLGITVSKDIAYVTVNGRTYTPSQFLSRWLKTVTIPVTETISRSETRTYTIIAYNSDGTASEPIVVKG